MNLPINLLPNNCASSNSPASKTASNRPSKSGSQNSFSDTLNKKVTESNETETVKEPDKTTREKSTNSVLSQNSAKKDVTDSKEQGSANEGTNADSDKSGQDTVPTQSANTNLTNVAINTAMLMGVPAVNILPANSPLTVTTEQTTTAIAAVTASQPQLAANQTDISPLLQQKAVGIFEENQPNQTNILQVGQQSSGMSEKLPSSNANIVAQGFVAQNNNLSPNTQNNLVQGETAPTPKQTTILQTNLNVQNQSEKAATNSGGVIVTQVASGLQSQATTSETVQNSKDQAITQNQLIIDDQTATPLVGSNQQGKTPNSDLNGEGQKNSLADTKIVKVSQDIAKEAEGRNTSVFSQNLDAALLSTTGIVSSVKHVEPQTQTSPYTDVQQVLDQIVEQTKIITKPQNTEMVMKLKPEHLGELTLKVVLENGVVNASFHSNNPEVRSLIETSLPQLKQELANTGLKVDNVSVYAGLGQFQPNQGQSQNSRQQLMKAASKKSADDFVEAIDGELTGRNTLEFGSQSGVDYRI